MALKAPMKGFLCRDSWGSVPTLFRFNNTGVTGVVSNINWGDLMGNQLYGSGTPAAYPAFTDTVGSSNFTADLAALEGSSSGTGAMADILSDMTAVEQNLSPGSQVKLRWFSGVGSSTVAALNSPNNPPSPGWLTSLCGFFVSNDSTQNTPYWVSGVVQANGDVVCSKVNGLQYTCISSSGLSALSNTVDPGNGASKWSAGQLGPYAGPVVRWFGSAAAPYLAAYSYFMQQMANARVWIDCKNYVNAGDYQVLGFGTGTWHAGPRPSGKDDTNSTAFTLDSCPMIGEITMSACCTIYGEVTIRQIGQNTHPTTPTGLAQYSATTAASFLAAGYTTYSGLKYTGSNPNVWSSANQGSGKITSPAPDSDLGQILACQAVCASAWQQTCISEAHNQFQIQTIADVSSGSSSLADTGTMINNLIGVCTTIGAGAGQAVPGNNSLKGSLTAKDQIVTTVEAVGAPTYFQTGRLSTLVAGIDQVIMEGAGASAYNIELPDGFDTGGSAPQTPTSLNALLTTFLGYISAGTGPSTGLNPNTSAYAASNTRGAAGGGGGGGTGGPIFTADTATPTATVGSLYTYDYLVEAPLTALNGVLAIKGAPSFSSPAQRNVACGYVPVQFVTAGSYSTQDGTINFGDLFPTNSTLDRSSNNPIEVALTEVATWNAGYPTTLTSAGATAIATAFSAGSGITSLKVVAIGYGYPPGTVTIKSGGHSQTFSTTGAASGATSIPTTSQVPSFSFPAGSVVAAVTNPQRLKVRIGSGVHSPSWMKSSTYGGTCQIIDPTGDTAGGGLLTLPNFWTKEFQDLWYSLMQTVATTYDDNPLIAEIVASPNMTFYCEPCLRQTGAPNQTKATGDPYTTGSGPTLTYVNPNGPNLVAAGFRAGDASTPYTDIWNQNQLPAAMAAMWPNTIVGVDFNPYQNLDITNPLTTSTSLTHSSSSGTTLTLTSGLPTVSGVTNVVATGDSILVRDNNGDSQIFSASANKTAGATSISITAATVTLASQSSYQVYNVQPDPGGDVTQLKWPIHVDSSDETTVEAMIAVAAATPNVSLENDSYRHSYIASSQDINSMYTKMSASLSNVVTMGIQTAQGPNIDGGSVPSTAHMQDIMTALAGMGVSHVEMYPSWSNSGTAEPDYSGPLSVAQVQAAAAALPVPSSSTITFGLDSGSFPHGISINSATGVLSGTPDTAGSSTFVVYAKNAAGFKTSGPSTTITVTGTSGGPSLLNDNPPDGVLGQSYTYTFTVSNPTGVTWTLTTVGSGLTGIPLGLTWNASTATLSGIPIGIPNSWFFSITATNSSGSTGTGTIEIDIGDPYPVYPVSVVSLGSSYARIN